MDTGRTPYSGESKNKKNIELAEKYREHYLIDGSASEEDQKKQIRRINGYKSINKYPARNGGEEGLRKFIENLENGIHQPEPFDAEYITRFEMQGNTPDILITNYSMLEYMLMRQMESGICLLYTSWTPVLIRPNQNDGYEMISGHRRMHVAQKTGLITIPSIVRERLLSFRR